MYGGEDVIDSDVAQVPGKDQFGNTNNCIGHHLLQTFLLYICVCVCVFF